MDLNILKLFNIFSYFKKERNASIQFNRKIINLTLPTKICNNFDTHVFDTSCRIQSFSTYPYF